MYKLIRRASRDRFYTFCQRSSEFKVGNILSDRFEFFRFLPTAKDLVDWGFGSSAWEMFEVKTLGEFTELYRNTRESFMGCKLEIVASLGKPQ